MNNCEIEIDFLRQSFRVIRNPSVLPSTGSRSSLLSPFLGWEQRKEYSGKSPNGKRELNHDKTPPMRRQNTVDKIFSINKKGKPDRRNDLAAGSIFTSIHVPLKPDNNFERIFNEMLPDAESTKGRCFCHLRPKPDVDVNAMMLDLMNNLCKSTISKPIESPQTAKSSTTVLQTSKRKSIQTMLTEGSTFWIGAEYRYNPEMNTLLLKFILLGTPPKHTRKLYVNVRLSDRKKNKVKRIDLKNSALNSIIMGKELAIQMSSLQNTLETKVHVQLEAKKGFLRFTKHIDEWVFPLDDCHCMYQRSYWRDVKQNV